jgi:hypothetical protein
MSYAAMRPEFVIGEKRVRRMRGLYGMGDATSPGGYTSPFGIISDMFADPTGLTVLSDAYNNAVVSNEMATAAAAQGPSNPPLTPPQLQEAYDEADAASPSVLQSLVSPAGTPAAAPSWFSQDGLGLGLNNGTYLALAVGIAVVFELHDRGTI